MSQLISGYIRVNWNRYSPVELKRFMEGGYQFMKNVDHYGCLTKKNYHLKSSTMARNTFNILHS